MRIKLNVGKMKRTSTIAANKTGMSLDAASQWGSRFRELITGWNPASERLCSIRIRGKLYNYSLICAHVFTDESDNDVKDEFYDSLDWLKQPLPFL